MGWNITNTEGTQGLEGSPSLQGRDLELTGEDAVTTGQCSCCQRWNIGRYVRKLVLRSILPGGYKLPAWWSLEGCAQAWKCTWTRKKQKEKPACLLWHRYSLQHSLRTRPIIVWTDEGRCYRAFLLHHKEGEGRVDLTLKGNSLMTGVHDSVGMWGGFWGRAKRQFDHSAGTV